MWKQKQRSNFTLLYIGFLYYVINVCYQNGIKNVFVTVFIPCLNSILVLISIPVDISCLDIRTNSWYMALHAIKILSSSSDELIKLYTW